MVALIRRDLTQIAHNSALAVKREIPSYADVPITDLEESVLRDARRVVDTLLNGTVPQPSEITEACVAAVRCKQGIPIEDVLQANRISLRELRDSFLNYARDLTIEAADISQATYLLWETADAATLQMAKNHREASIERALHDERRRVTFVRGLLSGSLDAAEFKRLASIYRLSLDRPYHALRAQPRRAASLTELRIALERSGGTTQAPAILCVVEEFVVGLVSKRPSVHGDQGTVGLGPRMPLDSSEQSYHVASRNLDTAWKLGWGGCFEVADLSWRIALVSEPEVGDHLTAKYIKPLAERGEFGTLLLQSIREYLACGRRLSATARRLHLHVNSLRYRLHKYESIVGVRLEEPNVALELYWALAKADLERALPSARSAPGPARRP